MNHGSAGEPGVTSRTSRPAAPAGRARPAPAWRVRVALVLASVALALGVTEVVLREFMPVRGMIYALDDRYLFHQIPGSRKLANAAGEEWPKVLVRINAAGRRGDESGWPRAARRVVVYGDSFISAEYTPEPETYVAQLERLLDARVDRTVVLNAGVTGYGVDQESLRIEDDLPRLRPDLVVVAAYAGNDFGDLLRDKLYRLGEDGRLVRNVPVIDEALREQFQAPFQLSSIQIVRAMQSAFERWTTRRAGRPAQGPPAGPQDPTARRQANRVAEYEEYIVRGDNVVRNLLADEYDADVSVAPDSPSARYRLLLMDRVIERIRQETDRNGARLLLLIIPERCDVAGTCGASQARRRYPGYRPSGLTDALAAIARRQGVACLDLFESFQRGGSADLYHPLDEHWNARGQLLAARLSAERILGAGLLGATPASPAGSR
jgi:lysophospholipase L1-like esterase